MPNQEDKYHYDPYNCKVLSDIPVRAAGSFAFFSTSMENIHALEDMPGVRFIAYPDITHSFYGHLISQMLWIDPHALFARRIFIGQFWNDAPLHTIQLMVDMYNPEYPGTIKVRMPDRHHNASLGARGCMHAIIQFYRPVNVDHFVSWLHKRFLYDRAGFWMATSPEGLEALNHYVANCDKGNSKQRASWFRGLPSQTVVCEYSSSRSRSFGYVNAMLRQQLSTTPEDIASIVPPLPIGDLVNELPISEKTSFLNT